MTEVIDKPRIDDNNTGYDDNWKVIVLDDNHNTFDSVAWATSSVIPGISKDRGYDIANEVHTRGFSVVWLGVKEIAELYHEQLASFGLTMAELQQ